MNELETLSTLSRLSQLYQTRTMLSTANHSLTGVNNEIRFLESLVGVSRNEQYRRAEERLKKLADEVKYRNVQS